MSIYGLNILSSPHALESTTDPVKIHPIKPWMSLNYHNRIQKKWIKRWGYIQKPCIWQTPQGFIAHPTLYKRLQDEMSRPSLC